MSSIRIILDLDKELDGIVAGTEIALTFAAAKFNSLVNRGGTLSNRFELAKTANNKNVLGVLEDVNDTKDSPYKLYDVQVVVDSNVVFRGLATIDEAQDTYGIRVFGGIANFFELVGDKTLRDLDLSAFDHAWTAANVNAARQNNNTQGYVYPNINYGRWTGKSLGNRPHTDFFPATYFKTLLETAATEEGYTLNNYNTNKVIPFSLNKFVNRTTLGAKISKNSSQTITNGIPLRFNMNIEDFDNFNRVYNINGVPTDKTMRITAGASVTVNAYAELTSAVTSVNNINVTLLDPFNPNTARLITVVIAPGETKELQFNDLVSQEFEGLAIQVSNGGSLGLTDEVTITSGAFIEIFQNGEEAIFDGNTIALSDIQPPIKVKDLFLYEAVRQNALIVTDPIARTIEFITMNSICDSKFNALDWSHKADTLTEPKREYRLNEYAQNNFLRYKEGIDEDPAFAANNNLGLGNFQVADRALKLDRDWYTAPFSGSGISGAFTDETAIIRIPRYSDTALTYDEPDLDPQPRVLDVSIDDSFLVNITGQSVLTTQANVTFEGFDQSVTNDYEALTAIFDKMKLLEVYVRLNVIDIQNLDITKPVYLLNSYWFIREISQYRVTSKESTKVKLIRL